ncbi:MAG: universal stress protein [Deltaproteobacteria bacterium]|jgi:nucleotide-binding universal stress UspA family protein|nr:universal stress protein [Deltaproteobacteria bacterium]
MKRIRKIMVAYDFSDYSKEALKFAAELADELKSDLMILNVINQREVDALRRAEIEGAGFSADQFIKDMKEDRLKSINEVIQEISAKHLPVEIKIKTGVPFRELTQAAKDGGVDLVVMGRKGRSNLAGILFGTTAEKMFRHCPVPLLSVREDMQR